ncbi:uncharacterized protein LTR77_002394 [Saxophila tyrrhenica]|uniref:Molybdenum cofactor sulfurase n=1 Tax=Saxophila tyrrhenica TaxID=1690608 RepID=A0AAV9PLW8_9PEZI|nr:hypothetical protein LTR77_002394 [Saxophila tyrrhenica]
MASPATPNTMDPDHYNTYISHMRQQQYPMLSGPSPETIYLDHAAATPAARLLLDRFHSSMLGSLYGNPHSASPSSMNSSQMVERVRQRVLRFFGAETGEFDVVFVANATAGGKLVAEGLREGEGFGYVYHADSHTSLVGVREVAKDSRCVGDEGVEAWLRELEEGELEEGEGGEGRMLFSWPAQSNMNGRRLPMEWCGRVRETARKGGREVFTLLDAAGLVSTSPLDLSDADAAPDFTILSFYKIFGFPDLGAVIVKKSAAHIFDRRKFFGGGTVDMVACMGEQWHAKKSGELHDRLEDGTLPVHSILALDAALDTHDELFGSLERVSRHTAMLAKELHDGLTALKYANERAVCKVHKHAASTYGKRKTQGPIVAFNLLDAHGDWVSNSEVEKLATIHNIHLRTGGVCNPGGIASALDLAPWEIKENFSAGHRCGSEDDVLNGKPTGVVRVSLGAMSTMGDVERFLEFVQEFFVCKVPPEPAPMPCPVRGPQQRLYVESLTVYPIKSCGGMRVPCGTSWEIRSEGLAWDREWCVVHQGAGKALSQKQYPRMALLRPHLDFKSGMLRLTFAGGGNEISVPLSRNPALYTEPLKPRNASVCGDSIETLTYSSPTIADFLTLALDVPCTLARFNSTSSTLRHSKVHLKPAHQPDPSIPRPLMLSNESPILIITRSSLNRLNETIKSHGGKAAHPSVFRANIVLAESSPGFEQPWAEDEWSSVKFGGEGPRLEVLGGCRRCQMVCVDQESAERDREPFSTLAKTRRVGGRVLFGVHAALVEGRGKDVRVGEWVEAVGKADGEDGTSVQ